MVEFALILPLFILLMAGVFDFTRAFYEYNQIVNATSEGARVGTYTQDVAAIRSAVQARSTIGLATGDITVTCYASFTGTAVTCSSVIPGDSVQVAATKNFQPTMFRVVQLVGSSVTLSSSAKRTIE